MRRLLPAFVLVLTAPVVAELLAGSTPLSQPYDLGGERYIIAAERVFDGAQVLEHHAVAVSGDRIGSVTPSVILAYNSPMGCSSLCKRGHGLCIPRRQNGHSTSC